MAVDSTRGLVTARGVRGFADGFASVLLARYLVAIGFSGAQIGLLVTVTLLGSAALTLVAGFRFTRFGARSVLLWSCALMATTGLGFGLATWFWLLLVVGFLGTLNPSGGDVSLFLPTEQAAVAGITDTAERPRVFAVYNLAGALAGAAGALASALPPWLAHKSGWNLARTERLSFLIYVLAAVLAAAVYLQIRDGLPGPSVRGGLHKSRRTVIRLSLLFALDSAGGGFALQSLLVLYLFLRFHLSPAATGATLAATGVLSAFSQLASPLIARRIGLVRTMVFTHLPANACLIAAGLVPNAGAAIAASSRALGAVTDGCARPAGARDAAR